MAHYTKILVALDYSDNTAKVLERAVALASDHAAELHLVHVVEYLPPMMMADEPFPSSVWMVNEEQLLESARERMTVVVAKISGLTVIEHVVIGAPRPELCTIAAREEADLMVAGSHGRHGVARLLGSTASSLVHHSPCDLLLVKISD